MEEGKSTPLELYRKLKNHESLSYFAVDLLKLGLGWLARGVLWPLYCLWDIAIHGDCNNYIEERMLIVDSRIGAFRVRHRYRFLSLLARLAALPIVILLYPVYMLDMEAPRIAKRLRLWLLTTLLGAEFESKLKELDTKRRIVEMKIPTTDLCLIMKAFEKAGCEDITHYICGIDDERKCDVIGMDPWLPNITFRVLSCGEECCTVVYIDNYGKYNGITELRLERVDSGRLAEYFEQVAEMYEDIAMWHHVALERVIERLGRCDMPDPDYDEDECESPAELRDDKKMFEELIHDSIRMRDMALRCSREVRWRI